MPRKPDADLQARILEAARQLFVKGGEKSLSMRALAKQARTNTPAVYRRFRNRDAILHAIVDRYRRDSYITMEPCKSLEEMAHAMLDLALVHPREYTLIYSELLSKVPGRSSFEFAKKRAAEWLGGSPDDHIDMILALSALIHGTAMLLISGAVTKERQARMRSAFSASVKVLLRDTAMFR
jgi:AcrR family transcriptional regulator